MTDKTTSAPQPELKIRTSNSDQALAGMGAWAGAVSQPMIVLARSAQPSDARPYTSLLRQNGESHDAALKQTVAKTVTEFEGGPSCAGQSDREPKGDGASRVEQSHKDSGKHEGASVNPK